MIIQGLTNSFRTELLQGFHDFRTDVVKMALYGPSASLDPTTMVYTSLNECSGPGYTPGGFTLAGQTIGSGPGVAWLDWNDPAYSGLSVQARGALLYNSTKANRSMLVLDFGLTRTLSGSGTIVLPNPTSTSALVRLA